MNVVYCHCRDCRRTSRTPVSLFVGYRMEQVETGPGVPKVYRSSLSVGRSFCGDRGTPLSYEDERLPGEVYVPVGVFDDPEPFVPQAHDWASQSLGWLDIHDDLPRHQKSSRLR